MTLNQISIGEKVRIASVNGTGALRDRLLDMGLTPHTEIKIQKIAPMGDPIEVTLRGYELTLRVDDAKKIDVRGRQS